MTRPTATADPLTHELADLLARIAGRCATLSAAVRSGPPAVFNAARLLVGLQAVANDLDNLDTKTWGVS